MWERLYLGGTEQNGQQDDDGDGLTNIEEFDLGTEPGLSDTDGDGKSDQLEVQAGDDPLVASTPDGKPVTRPIADAGQAQTVCEGAEVRLQGNATEVAGVASFQWTQTEGPSVELYPDTAPRPLFIAPQTEGGNLTLTFRMDISNSTDGADSDICTVVVTPRSPGDLNCTQSPDIGDAILALKIVAGIQPNGNLASADMNGDDAIGLEEAIFSLQGAADMR